MSDSDCCPCPCPCLTPFCPPCAPIKGCVPVSVCPCPEPPKCPLEQVPVPCCPQPYILYPVECYQRVWCDPVPPCPCPPCGVPYTARPRC